jgi:hypothetical protein
MKKCLLTLSLAKPREKAKGILKTYELFMDTYITMQITSVKKC